MNTFIPCQIPGGKKTKEIIGIVARYQGYSIGAFIRNCINKEIIKSYDIDISQLENESKSKGLALPGSPADTILSIKESI